MVPRELRAAAGRYARHGHLPIGAGARRGRDSAHAEFSGRVLRRRDGHQRQDDEGDDSRAPWDVLRMPDHLQARGAGRGTLQRGTHLRWSGVRDRRVARISVRCRGSRRGGAGESALQSVHPGYDLHGYDDRVCDGVLRERTAHKGGDRRHRADVRELGRDAEDGGEDREAGGDRGSAGRRGPSCGREDRRGRGTVRDAREGAGASYA